MIRPCRSVLYYVECGIESNVELDIWALFVERSSEGQMARQLRSDHLYLEWELRDVARPSNTWPLHSSEVPEDGLLEVLRHRELEVLE